MIEQIEARHNGARVEVRLKPGTLRVQEGKDTIEVRSIGTTLFPGMEAGTPYVKGSGLRVLVSGSLGTQDRTIYGMRWNTLPEEVRDAMMAAAREVLSNHEI